MFVTVRCPYQASVLNARFECTYIQFNKCINYFQDDLVEKLYKVEQKVTIYAGILPRSD